MKKQKCVNELPMQGKNYHDADIPKDLKIPLTDNWSSMPQPDYNRQPPAGPHTWDYEFIYDQPASASTRVTPPYSKRMRNCPDGQCNIKPAGRWLGALVRFRPMYYDSTTPSYIWTAIPNPYTVGTSIPNHTGTGGYDDSTISRLAWPAADIDGQAYLSYTGTVISVDDQPNYKGQYHVSVLWADGPITYENIADLEIIQPGN